MKYFQVSMLSWFPVCGTNTQGRVLWGGGINCRWQKQFRKFGITMPEVLHLSPSCTLFCSDDSLYSCDKWHFKPDPALCTTAAFDWSVRQKPTQRSAALVSSIFLQHNNMPWKSCWYLEASGFDNHQETKPNPCNSQETCSIRGRKYRLTTL